MPTMAIDPTASHEGYGKQKATELNDALLKMHQSSSLLEYYISLLGEYGDKITVAQYYHLHHWRQLVRIQPVSSLQFYDTALICCCLRCAKINLKLSKESFYAPTHRLTALFTADARW